MDLFKVNFNIHGTDIRLSSNLHLTAPHASLHEKGTYCMGIKVFNILLCYTKDLAHKSKQFKLVLKNFLYSNSFYTFEEYFNYNST
jgi:hypothetical protein